MTLQALRRITVIYVALAILTLIFQFYVRSQTCAAAGICTVEYTKAFIWAAIWPASWLAYLKGVNLAIIYMIVGVALIILGICDQIWSRSTWRFHAFYTGLALLLVGQTLDYLLSIRTLSDAILYDMRRGGLNDHVVAIRTLLDKIAAPR